MIQIIGAGGFANEVVVHLQSKYRTKPEVEFFVQMEYIKEGLRDVDELSAQHPALICVGKPSVKRKLYQYIPHNFNDEPNSPEKFYLNAGVCHSKLNNQCIICPGAIVTTNVKFGICVHVNLNATIGHDSSIGNFTTISPGANISGNVNIGDFCYIGTGAAIREGITICDGVTIGAGAVVVKDITEPGTYVGNPVRKL